MSHLFCGRYTYLNHSIDVLSVCKNCDVRISEMMEFLSSDRLHMQQAMFPKIMQNHILHSDLTLDVILCKVLVGIPLKQNEFLKIDGTCLGEVISEEAGNKDVQPVSPLQGKGEEEGGEKMKTALEGEKMDSPLEEVCIVTPYTCA